MRRQLETLARIAGLWAIAIAHPLLDTLARGPEFLVAQRADAIDVLILIGALAVLPPVVLTGLVGLAATAGQRARLTAEALIVAVTAAAFAIQVGYRAGIHGWTGTAFVAAASVALVFAAWLRFPSFRTFATMVSPAAIVVPVVFLTASGIRPLVWRTAEQALGPALASAPVVVLVFDELPLVSILDEHGEIDSGRFPNLVRLAADGIWYRNATTSSDYTRWALPAIVSGLRPGPDSTPLFQHHPRNLFTLLGASHRIEALEPITALCPAQLCAQEEEARSARLAAIADDLVVLSGHVLLPPDARASLPSLTANWAGFGAQAPDDGSADRPLWRRIWDRRIDEDHARSTMRFVAGIAPDDPQPTLYFMHTLASHHPLRWLPSGQAVQQPRRTPGLSDDVWTEDPWPVIQSHQGHLIQAGLVDTVIGRIRARLEAAGIYEESLIVVTSDHGISFNPGDELRSVTETNAGDIVPVPLIVKLPADRPASARGVVDERLVESIDLLPTIADGLGIALPWPVDGVSALGRETRRSVEVYVRDAHRRRTFEAREIAAERAAALERKLSRFGGADWPLASAPGLGSLPGRPVSAFEIGSGDDGLRVHIDRPYALRQVRLDGPALPVQLTGRLEPAARVSRHPVFLAVALNGTIVATTQTWRRQAGWMALLPPHALREGENQVEVFRVRRDRATRLVRLPHPLPDPRGVNLLFARSGEWGIEHVGFFQRERSGGRSFRWTDGAGVIRLPLPRGTQPVELSLDLRSTGPAGKQLRVLVDDCEVLAETLEGGALSRSVSLGRCGPPGDELVVRIASDTHQPRRDRRRLGVALSSVVLR